MLTLLWKISLKRSGLEHFYVETVGFSQKKSQKMSGDSVVQWVSLIWAALEGYHELDFCVLSCLEVRGWMWGQCLWRCHKCGIMAASVGVRASRSVACTLCAEVSSPLPCASATAATALGWAGSGSQTRGQLAAFLVESLGWLLTSLNFRWTNVSAEDGLEERNGRTSLL